MKLPQETYLLQNLIPSLKNADNKITTCTVEIPVKLLGEQQAQNKSSEYASTIIIIMKIIIILLCPQNLAKSWVMLHIY